MHYMNWKVLAVGAAMVAAVFTYLGWGAYSALANVIGR